MSYSTLCVYKLNGVYLKFLFILIEKVMKDLKSIEPIESVLNQKHQIINFKSIDFQTEILDRDSFLNNTYAKYIVNI